MSWKEFPCFKLRSNRVSLAPPALVAVHWVHNINKIIADDRHIIQCICSTFSACCGVVIGLLLNLMRLIFHLSLISRKKKSSYHPVSHWGWVMMLRFLRHHYDAYKRPHWGEIFYLIISHCILSYRNGSYRIIALHIILLNCILLYRIVS